MQMGSRLRPDPERVLECLIEVSAPTNEQGATLLSFYPENYEDADMLRDVVPKFCFPFDHDSEMVDAVQHFTFVLTDIDGLYRFGFCRYPAKAKTCLCILSDLAAFDMFYGMLNTIAELKINTGNETVNQFMDLVLKSDVPKPDCKFTIQLPVQKKQWEKQFNYPDPTKLPSIPENRNLTDYFSAVNPNNMIALFASMMCERRIIVTSKKLSLLTACTYSASSLLYPMHWQHVFIPVIPPSLLDYCCAPMPFLVGVHSSLMHKVRDMPLDDVVILDIDKNEIEVPFNDLENLPSEAVNKLNSALKKTTIAIGDYVSKAFLYAIVDLIGSYRDALKMSSSDTIIFEREIFVNSRPHMKPFLENLLTLQLFERFVHHRLELLNSGEGIDDIFEEQVGQQGENNSKWAGQYKQWVKNRKKNLRSISGKTEKATNKAHKYFQIGWREAVKGLKEKKNDLIEYVKGKEDENTMNGPAYGIKKSNSLPSQKAFAVNQPPTFQRKSVGSYLHNQVLLDTPPTPQKSPCPSRPRAPPPPPPRPSPPPRSSPPVRPVPYKSPSKSTDDSPLELRKSMVRNPNDPPVKDLISFYSQEDLSVQGNADPFKAFKEFDYNSKDTGKTNETGRKPDVLEMNGALSNDSDLTTGSHEGLLWDTMISLSADTRQFLRNSRLLDARDYEKAMLVNGKREDENVQNVVATKKTLKEIALGQKNASNSLIHSGSCPPLFDPSANTGATADQPRNSSSKQNEITRRAINRQGENRDLGLSRQSYPRTNSDDLFVELINQRHNIKLEGLNLADNSPRNESTSKHSWVADFE